MELKETISVLENEFTPSKPVSNLGRFMGREEELEVLAGAIGAEGKAAIIYGERGVGKSSLAEVSREYLADRDQELEKYKTSLNGGATFSSVMKSIFRDFKKRGWINDDYLEDPPEYQDVNAMVQFFQESEATGKYAIILDELDKLIESDDGFSELEKITNFIKSSSDGASEMDFNLTVILIGIADSVGQLVAQHISVSRNLEKILLPRMNDKEARSLLETVYNAAGIGYDDLVLDELVELSSGVPHFVHLLGQKAGIAAVERCSSDAEGELKIEESDIRLAIPKAEAEVDLDKKHLEAIQSPQKNAKFNRVLLACSLAKGKDPYGYFRKADLIESYRIVSREVQAQQSAYSSNVDELTKPGHGRVLSRRGEPKKYTYRFSDPMMETYVRIRAFANGELKFVKDDLGDSGVRLVPNRTI